MLRVRFAPSPTGYLHNTQQPLDSIFDGLNWLELGWDGQYRQSERLELHRKAAEAIAKKVDAYRDFTPAHSEEDDKSHAGGPWLFNAGMRELSPEESDRRAASSEPFVWRYRVPRESRKEVRFQDSAYGDQSKATADIEDFALLRSDGYPMYHLASCAEDADQRISHIIRGQDHLSNTFKHILIVESLGAQPPQFAHLPLLAAPDGAKLFKRKHGAVVSVTTYRDAGFLPRAYVDFLCLLGWSPKDNREQLSRPKALWLNSQHLRAMPPDELVPSVRKEFACGGIAVPYGGDWLRQTVDVIRWRFFTLKDFATRGRAFFADDFRIEPDALEKLEKPGTRPLLRELAQRLAAASEPSAFTVFAAIGRERAIERLSKVQ